MSCCSINSVLMPGLEPHYLLPESNRLDLLHNPLTVQSSDRPFCAVLSVVVVVPISRPLILSVGLDGWPLILITK
eukprot:scaffold1884_cov343-Ochromonas_danica.AAC.57